MGASKNFDLQKCGEILLDIKKIKHKTKSYTFCCAFCSDNCDQLKKFTKHLEEKHLQNFEDNVEDVPEELFTECRPDDVFESENIKVEEKMYVDELADETELVNNTMSSNVYNDTLVSEKIETNDDNLIENDSKLCPNVYNDPLKTEKEDTAIDYETHNDMTKKSNSVKCLNVYSDAVKTEINVIKNHEPLNSEKNIIVTTKDIDSEEDGISYGDDSYKMKYENNDNKKNNQNCTNREDAKEEPKKVKKDIQRKKKAYNSDISSDDSKDSDFDLEKELCHDKKPKKLKKENEKVRKKRKEPKKEIIDDYENTIHDSNRLMAKSKHIIKPILPTLIKQYKKCELLWNVDHIEFGIRAKRIEVLTKLAQEISSSFKKKINLAEINYHIRHLNLLYSKDKKEDLICKKENKDFTPKSKFYTELSFLSGSQGPFVCSICNEMVPKYDPYCHHIAKHNGTQPFACPSCKMSFTKFHKLIIHKKRHLGLYNFHCPVCGKGYPFQAELDWHLTSHTGDKPFLCAICGEGFRARHAHAHHVKRHENPFPHKCHICEKGFVGIVALNSHIKLHFNVRDVICKICNKGFTHSKYLKRHEKKAHPNNSYSCNGCEQLFSLESDLYDHQKMCNFLSSHKDIKES